MTRARLTSVERVLWPATGFTKGQMLAYYERIAPLLLPHLAGRPLTLGRFPAGVDGPGFAQTECSGRPDWVRTVPVRLRSGEVRNQCVVDDLDSLLWVANLGSIELHAFPSRPSQLDEPAFVIFDLDPGPGAGLLECCAVALALREALGDLQAFVKTTGGSGLHLQVPLAAGQSFDRSRAFAQRLAEQLARERPRAVTASRRRGERAGRVLIDWLPNAPRALSIVAYSLRAADVPRAAAPIGWEEVETAAAAGDPSRLRLGPEAALERTADPSRAVPEQRLPG